jgi:hypothetical protein
MKKPTASAAGGALPAEGHKPDPRLMALRQAIDKVLGEMDLDGIIPVDERGMFADAIFDTLRRSPLFASMKGEA